MTRKKAKLTFKKLLQQYNLLMEFLDKIPDVIYFKDKKGRLTLVNRAHAKGLGLEPEDVVGKTDFDIFPKNRAQMMAKDDEHVLKTGQPIIDKIERGTRPDGIDNYVSTTKIPRFDAKGRIIGLIGITRDITQRVHYEHLREERLGKEGKLQLLKDIEKIKSEFLSAVSHELKTPLSIINQLVLLVFDETAGPISDKQREILVKVRQNIDRLRAMIDTLLDIARIKGGQLQLHYSLVNLSDLFKDSQNFFEKLAKEADIQLTYHLPEEEIMIFVDPERIVQVISNLINNAIKFTEANGKIKVDVKILETKIRVGVIDTGMGIAKKDLPRVFDKFVQVGDPEVTATKGVGLGLTIAKELVERHGGEIWLESQFGVGTKVYFTLPRFYTADVLTPQVRNTINELLEKEEGVVYLVNLVIINYEEFKKRVDIGPQKLSEDLRESINRSFQEFYDRQTPHQLLISDIERGRYSIVFPSKSKEDVVAFCELLKEKTKNYFTKHKISNVFVILGILSYSSKAQVSAEEPSPSNLKIREIYIGSEMRRFKRFRYETKIEVMAPAKATQTSRTVDLSQGGLCFISHKPLPADAKIKVRFHLLRKRRSICAAGRVTWLGKMGPSPKKAPQGYKIGLEFLPLEKRDKELLLDELKLYYE